MIFCTPQPSERDIAAIVWDALAEGRRADVVELLAQTMREVGDSVTEWVIRPGIKTLECRFCRAQVRELRLVRPHRFETARVPWSASEGDAHERCAVGVVAGLVKPKKVRERRRPLARDVAALPLYWEMDPTHGNEHVAVPVTIWGEGFRTRARIRVAFGHAEVAVDRIVSDHELVVSSPYVGIGTFDVAVTIGKTVHRLAQKHWVPYAMY